MENVRGKITNKYSSLVAKGETKKRKTRKNGNHARNAMEEKNFNEGNWKGRAL